VQTTATTWNFAPPDSNQLAELLKFFGCADAVAPVETELFGRRAGELIRQAASAVREEKPLGNAVELRSITGRGSLLNALHNAPRSDRAALLAAAVASVSLLVTAGAVLSDF
jgi:hypothetical protein